MAHLDAIGASMFADLAISMPATPPTAAVMNGLSTLANFKTYFATEIQSKGGTKAANTFVRVKNVREFPAIGTPANIVNVPTYGSKTSLQVQGQADAPNLELTLNYVADDWADGTLLKAALDTNLQYIFRFALLQAAPTNGNYGTAATAGTNIGSVKNSQFYWIGKVEALQVNPQLTDAVQATLTLSVQSAFFGAFTED